MFSASFKHARFEFHPPSQEEKYRVGNALAEIIRQRIHRGLTVRDVPAEPLHKGPYARHGGYAQWKLEHGLQAIRDMTRSGRTLESLRVLSVSGDDIVIGFADARAERIARINNLISEQFGVSPEDARKIRRLIHTGLLLWALSPITW